MHKLNLPVLQPRREVGAQAPQLPPPAVRRVAAQQEQVQPAREQLELAQQQVRPALRELLRERYQPLVQPLQALAWLALSVLLLWRLRSSMK